MNNRKLFDLMMEVIVKGNLIVFIFLEGNLRKLICGVYLFGIMLFLNRFLKVL